MLKWINFLRGYVEIEVEAAFPERVLNLCSQNGIPFWGLVWLSSRQFRVRLRRKDYSRLSARAEKLQCTIRVTRRSGLPFFLRRFRRRYALVAGMAALVLMMGIGSLFIWDIDVSGNTTVSDAEILSALEELGVGIGTFGPSVDSEVIKHHVLLKIDKLSWIAVNVSGSRAHVLVRERVLPPEIVDETIPANLVAEKTGVITRMEVYNGEAQFKVGSTVLAGELLVSGIMDVPTVGTRIVRAEGKVYARTWYELSAKTFLSAAGKDYTGRGTIRWSLLLGDRRINFYWDGRIPFDDYDKIKTEYRLILPDGSRLPLSMVTETCREFEPEQRTLSAAGEKAALEAALREELQAKIGGGKILKTRFSSAERGGVLTVFLVGECEEQIAKTVELPKEG